jgi:leucyl aminopeptidase (aminopeptidase T)
LASVIGQPAFPFPPNYRTTEPANVPPSGGPNDRHADGAHGATDRGDGSGGEIAISPVTGSAEGVLVQPFCIEKKELGYVTEKITIEVRGGRMARIGGGAQADFLAQVLDTAGGNARNIAELAIGTNPRCRLGVTIREAKKASGTAHIGIGDSKSVGGDVEGPLHFDLVFVQPTVTVDGFTVVRDGKIVG